VEVARGGLCVREVGLGSGVSSDRAGAGGRYTDVKDYEYIVQRTGAHECGAEQRESGRAGPREEGGRDRMREKYAGPE
jgi:hypothetical protein